MADFLNRTGAAAALMYLTACVGDNGPPAAVSESGFSFIVVGDTPNNEEDEAMLAEALPMIKAGDHPFAIHIGDYKSGGAACTDDHDEAFAKLIDDLKPTPVFYTPGDNEWTDCDRREDARTGELYSDLDRLERVRALFFATLPETHASMAYRRQETQVENAMWTYRNVRFLTLHVTGTNNARDWVTGDPLARAAEAAAARDAANLAWLAEGFAVAREENADAFVIAMQADMTNVRDKPEDVMCESVAANNQHPCDAFTDLRAKIRDEALTFNGPALVIHGDTAPFTLNQSFAGEEAANLWRLNAAGDAGIGQTGLPYGTRDITVVTIDPSAEEPFGAAGLLTRKTPRR